MARFNILDQQNNATIISMQHRTYGDMIRFGCRLAKQQAWLRCRDIWVSDNQKAAAALVERQSAGQQAAQQCR
jgi:hypothetical protein